MARVELELSDCCNYIDSSKLTERKKRVEEMRTFLQNPVIINHINFNSDRNTNSIQWNHLYQAVHRSTLKEGDKYLEEEAKGKSTTSSHTALKNCSSLLILIASKANADKARLSCRDLVLSVLQILENDCYKRILSPVYISILYQYILLKKRYWGEINLQQWIDLLNLSLPMFNEASSEKDKSVIVSALDQICLHGSRFADFIPCCKKLLECLPEIIKDVTYSKSSLLQSNVIQLAITLCQLLQKEYRLFICKFGEETMTHLIKMIESRTGDASKKKELIATLIFKLIAAHHPCEVSADQPGSMVATCWSTWTSNLRGLFFSLQNELDNLGHGIPVPSYPPVVELAALIAKLVMNQLDDTVDDSALDVSGEMSFSSPAVKRRRLTTNFTTLVDNVRCKKRIIEAWPWFLFVELVVTKYPETLQEDDFISVFRLISDYLGSSADKVINISLWRCANGLLFSEKYIKESLEMDEKLLQNLWSNIWATALRDITRSEINYDPSAVHTFIQTALKVNCATINTEALLNIYTDHEFIGSREDINTLKILCTKLTFPDSSNTKKFLIKMLLNKYLTKDCLFAFECAEALFSLLLTTKSPLSSEQSVLKSWDELDIFYMETSLETAPPFPSHQNYGSCLLDETSEVCVSEDKEICQEFMKICKNLTDNLNDKDLLYCAAFIYQIHHLLSKYNLSITNELNNSFQSIFNRFWSHLEKELDNYRSNIPTELIKEFNHFTAIATNCPEIFINKELKTIAKLLFEIVEWQKEKTHPSSQNTYSFEDSEDKEGKLWDESILEKSILQILTNLGYIEGVCYGKNAVHNNLLKYISYNIDTKTPEGFHIAITTVRLIIKQKTVYCCVLSSIISLLRELCDSWYKQTNEFTVILKTLTECILPLHKSNASENHLNYCELVSCCSKLIFSKHYGPKLVSEFATVIGTMIKIDSECKWKFSFKSGEPELQVRFHLLEFLKNKFNEVRTNAIQFIPYVFENQQDSPLKRDLQSELFNKMIDITKELFTVKGNLSEADVEEESMTIASSVLRILLKLIVSSNHWRRKSLYNLFNIVKSKNINNVLAQKILKQIEVQLHLDNVTILLEQNLDFIALAWYIEHHNFRDFPYSLLSCTSRKVFYTDYKTCIVPILLEKGDETILNEICGETENANRKVVEDCFPEVISSLLPKLGEVDGRHGAQAMYYLIQQIIGGEKLKELLSAELDKVLVALYEKLHDEVHFKTLCGYNLKNMEFPLRTSSHIFVKGITFTLEYLQKTSPDTTVPLLVFLSKEYCTHIYHLLQSLTANISEATTNEIRLLCFHQYATLCDNLATSMADLGQMAGYTIRSVVHTLLHLLNTDLASASLCFLNRFLSLSLPSSPNIVNDLLHVIVPKLVPIVSQEEKVEAKTSLQILKLLMVEYKGSLPAVSNLDRLPDKPIFSQFSCSVSRATLVDEIEHFLKVSDHQIVDLSTREHGLLYLHQQLVNRKSELIELYAQLRKMQGFAEDCAKSAIHRLIASLVFLTTSSNSTVSVIAGRCLGELGPSDLSTFALKPEHSENFNSLASTLLMTLLPLMVHKNPNIAENSCEVLRSLLTTREGHEAADKLSEVEASYLTPLRSKLKRPYSVKMCIDSLKEAMNYWCPINETQSHFSWISKLVSALLSSFELELSFFRLLIPLVNQQVKVAEIVLPYVTYIILKEEDHIVPIMEEKINLFFSKHFWLCKNHSNIKDKTSISVYMNRASVQCMLSVVNFYRQKEMYYIQRLRNNLKLNYLHVAQAAQYCRAYFTSILYAELWANAAMSSLDGMNAKQRSPPLELVCEQSPEDGIVLQTLLWDAYEEIGEPDAVYGCGNIHLIDTCKIIKYYKQIGMWSRIIDEYELNTDNIYKQDYVEALKMSGHYSTAEKVSGDKLEYDCAWRLGNWSLEVPADGSAGYSGFLYGALKAVQLEDNASVKIFIDKARAVVLDSLHHASLEVANSIYLPLSRLQALNEIEYIYGKKKSEKLIMPVIKDCPKWELLEPILVQRALLMDPAPQVWLDAAKFQAKYSYPPLLAHRYLKKVMKMSATESVLHEAKLEEAQLVWSSGDYYNAKYLLKKFIATNEDLNDSVLSTALLTYGRWIAETKSDKPTSIIQKFFLKATKFCESTSKERLAAADCLAHYADSEFQRKKQYLMSGEYASKVQNIDISSRTGEELKVEMDKDKDKVTIDQRKALLTYQVQSKIDKDEAEIAKKEFTEYLRLAVREYLKCLIVGEGDSNDLKMFRLVSLWFDNLHHPGLQNELDSFLSEVPTYKFLPVLSQLAVRIAPMDGSHFLSTLQNLLIRCSEDHPHHSLPLLLALANSEKDLELLQHNSNNSSKKNREKKNPEARVLGAQELLDLMLSRGKIEELIKLMQILSVAYISLANCEVSRSSKTGDCKIPTNEPIRKLKRLSNIPCITFTVPVSKSGVYTNIIGIEKFDDVYSLVGGVNQPKKVKCLCTDGVYRDQLVKGKDDLRQDAVMQQVFTVMNTLLRNDEKTAGRKLNIRTYKVIPLSQRSGVIEWVKDSEPFGNYLVGTPMRTEGAHVKYRPQDLSPNDCRKKIQAVAKSSKEERIQVYKEVCSHFKPVFRHFFFEKYTTPGAWFERRVAYTKSVATNSMIGYILGIGDRHVINVLIDQITAEMVHIDFGIAFEQGRILPTPETVPFRLTRDVVDGMGVSGIEGVFKRCCEETMTVLRKRKEPILTTLEVLLYDPLYTWTISPTKAQSLQEQETLPVNNEHEEIISDRNINKRNALAERALLRLKEKLEGLEDGSYTSVEGQVNSLIRTARDPSNLALLFSGWQAYL